VTDDQHTQQDPTTQYQQPPYDEQTQMDQHPGHEQEMGPKPDYGYETYRGSGRLEGKKAVITGGDSGIGRAVALAFAREGADVVISYLPEEEPDAQETAGVVEEAGRQCVKLPGDVSDEAQCQLLIQNAVDEFGRIDVLVNNAAHQMTVNGIADISTELLDRTFKTNIYAMFWLVKAALPHMPEGGSIQYGLRANTVAPGPVWTPIIPASMPADTVSQFGGTSPMGRPAQPAELAPAFVFLASQEAGYVNGETLGVTGGQPLP
jgi:NAD(P)-dependent dehydrogenase (short-subunit alcohol dehydrogenase family)